MRLPRDVSAGDLIKGLKKFDYSITRQTGSHIRLTTNRNGEHHLTVPNHDPLKIGTLSSILAEAAAHLHVAKDEVAAFILK
jgi:predicted RNA binding protein YcfA (HicA-like mRNA interferase family)